MYGQGRRVGTMYHVRSRETTSGIERYNTWIFFQHVLFMFLARRSNDLSTHRKTEEQRSIGNNLIHYFFGTTIYLENKIISCSWHGGLTTFQQPSIGNNLHYFF